MNSFRLKIVTPSGLAFDGPAEELIVRTTTGDLGILAGHLPCVAPLGMGRATVITEGKRKYAACIGGMVSVMDGHVNLVPTSFEWAEDIDPERVADSERRAREVLKEKTSTATDIRLAEARLKRALVRKSIVQE
jgi:F-type H+-transporting ATPase subunit epsilon